MLPPKRSWPFVAGLVLFVTTLGVLPHARFSLLIGQLAYFESAYDEATYALWAFAGGGPSLPNRWLSQVAMMALFKTTGSSWDLAMILADVAFPALCAVLAWVLTSRLTHLRLLRLVIAFGLLFAQEFFSLGCWTIWQFHRFVDWTPWSPSVPLDWRWARAAAPPWMLPFVPDYASPFLALFRSPEPQISQCLLLATLILLFDLSLSGDGRAPQRNALLVPAGVVLNTVLALTYLFHAALIVTFEVILCLTLGVRGQRTQARIAGGLAVIGAASILLGVLKYHGDAAARDWSFSSRLPVLTPASIVAAVGLVLVTRLLWRQRDGHALVPAAACFGSVLVVTNQQVVSGLMISTRDWERYVDYPIVFLGVIVISGLLLRRARVRVRHLYALAGAGLLMGVHLLIKAQDRVFEEEFLVANLKSMAMKRAVEAVDAAGGRGTMLVLEDPELSSLLQFRLNRRAHILLDGTQVFLRNIDPLEKSGGKRGRDSPFCRQLFEYLARIGRQPASVGRIFGRENDAGGGYHLSFLFDLKDWWGPITDGRRLQREAIRSLLPGIVRDYEQYLARGDACWVRPAVLLTRQSPSGRSVDRWDERFLVESTVGRASPLMNVHALLQTPSSAALAEVGAASGPCEP